MLNFVLLSLPIMLLLIGLFFLLFQLYKMFFCNVSSIKDVAYECLNSDSKKIKEVSMKYRNRIRGSVRLSQGRIKSVEEMLDKEKEIIFP